MRCREFERLLPDWIAGCLLRAQSQQMQAHHSSCAPCQKAALEERELRLRWQYLPSPPDVPTLWPRLSQHIVEAPRQHRLLPNPARTLRVGLVALGLCLGVLWARLPSPPAETTGLAESSTAATVDESHIVQMVREIRQLPENDNNILLGDTQQNRRRLLLSREDR